VKLSLCESVTASSISPWCIRVLTKEGKKLGGGVDTASLCGRVRPPMGWDLALDFEEYMARGGSKVCKRCLEAWKLQ
jgi:hypothetical protein